jgi:hypothetical protein
LPDNQYYPNKIPFSDTKHMNGLTRFSLHSLTLNNLCKETGKTHCQATKNEGRERSWIVLARTYALLSGGGGDGDNMIY